MRDAQFAKVTWPSVQWAGWYDIFLHGHLYAFDGYQHKSDPSVRGKHYLVVDPLGHCQKGAKYVEPPATSQSPARMPSSVWDV